MKYGSFYALFYYRLGRFKATWSTGQTFTNYEVCKAFFFNLPTLSNLVQSVLSLE